LRRAGRARAACLCVYDEPPRPWPAGDVAGMQPRVIRRLDGHVCGFVRARRLFLASLCQRPVAEGPGMTATACASSSNGLASVDLSKVPQACRLRRISRALPLPGGYGGVVRFFYFTAGSDGHGRRTIGYYHPFFFFPMNAARLWIS